MISQKDRNQSRELIGMSVPVGSKRNADELENSTQSYASGSLNPGPNIWKKTPTRIRTPIAQTTLYGAREREDMTRGPSSRSVKPVLNPYGRISGGNPSDWGNGHGRTTNPTARNTITDYQTASKRQKTGKNDYKNSFIPRYYDTPGGSTSALPISSKWVSRYTFIPANDHSEKKIRATRQELSSPPPNKPVIDVDSFDLKERDNEISAQREILSVEPDEMNLFKVSGSADVSPKLSIERHATHHLTANLPNVGEPNTLHPSRKGGQLPKKPWWPLCLVDDGPSTARIRVYPNLKKRRTLLEESPTDDSVGEIENTDSTIKRDDFPWLSGTNVQKLKERFEHKARSRGPPHLDLFAHGVKDKMKGKINTKSQELKIEKSQPKSSRNSQHDRFATGSTRYRGASVSVPLKLCIWGKDMFRLPGDAVDPEYWLVWNKRASQLQLCKHPIGLRITKQIHRSLSFKLLDIKEVIVATDDSLSIIITLNHNPRLSDDLASVGLVFKVIDKYLDDDDDSFRALNDLLIERAGHKNRKQVVHPDSITSLERAIRQYESYMSQVKEKLADPSDASVATSSGSGIGKSTQAVKNTTVRPRPLYGGKTINEALMPLRRSSRLSSGTPERQATPVIMDEIILVYPPSGSGAVNVTNGDLRRLEPSEFLNDTLIELGLKLWLNDLRVQQPALAEEIHVFSSFFYKKLNHKLFAEGYKSLRKWTTKVDIFKKKYIIIPINENVHWYLAIIYHPEHILDPLAMRSAPRTSKRTSNAAARFTSNGMRDAAEGKCLDTASRLSSPDLPTGPATVRDEDSDVSVEQVITATRSCSIDDEVMDEQHQTKTSDSPSDAELAHPTEMDLDKSSDHTYDAGDDNVSMEQLGLVEGGGPQQLSADVEVVPDSEGDEPEDEGTDQLCDDDDDDDDRIEPTEWSQSSSITPVPPRSVFNNQPSKSTEDSHIVDLERSSPSGNRATLAYPIKSFKTLKSNQLSAEEDGISLMDVDPVNNHETPRERPRSPLYRDIGDVEHDAENSRSPSAVSSASFYSTQSKMMLKNDEQILSPIDVSAEQILDEGENAWNNDFGEQPRTWIFSLDSLGGRHPSVFNKLNQYLHAEAKDKKGVDNPSNALTKIALVPAQPNYCDCGLYLLHFAKTFMSDPEKYKNAICSTRKSAVNERNALWFGNQVGTMREEMKARILAESESWKKFKADKNLDRRDTSESSGPTPAMELSDDEIEVSEVKHRGVSSSVPIKESGKAAAKPTRMRV